MGSNFDTMSRETTSHPAASKALPIDFVPQNSSSSLGMFNNYHQHNKARTGKGAAQAVSHARTNLFFNRGQLEYDAGGGMQLIECIPPPETQPNEKRPETTPNRNGTRFQPGQPAPTQCIRQVLLTCSGTTPSETQRKTCTNYELQVVACQEGPRPRTKGGRGGRRRRPRHCQEVTG